MVVVVFQVTKLQSIFPTLPAEDALRLLADNDNDVQRVTELITSGQSATRQTRWLDPLNGSRSIFIKYLSSLSVLV